MANGNSDFNNDAGKTKVVWTAKDQAALDELTARKQRVFDAGLDELRTAMDGVQMQMSEKEDLVAYMADNAPAIRDALRTFDGRDSK